MQPESPAIPHSLVQVLWLLFASFLGWTGAEVRAWLARRKREPIELERIRAETRQISVSTDVSLIQAASDALGKVYRLQEERDHWERKAGVLQQQLDQAETQRKLDELQIRRMKAILEANRIKVSDYDNPRSH